MTKFVKVLGILALTLLGVILIFGAHLTAIHLSVPVNLSGDGRVYVLQWDSGYVSATGTWVIDQERHSSPLNVSKVSCVRDEHVCYEAQANVNSGYLNSDLDTYPIVRWDTSTIQFQNNFPACVSYIYVIDRATQKLSGRRTKKADADNELCGIISDDLRLSFTDGHDVVKGLRLENAPTATSLVIGTGFVFLMFAWIWKVVRREGRT